VIRHSLKARQLTIIKFFSSDKIVFWRQSKPFFHKQALFEASIKLRVITVRLNSDPNTCGTQTRSHYPYCEQYWYSRDAVELIRLMNIRRESYLRNGGTSFVAEVVLEAMGSIDIHKNEAELGE
jgi:hypothetical protein